MAARWSRSAEPGAAGGISSEPDGLLFDVARRLPELLAVSDRCALNTAKNTEAELSAREVRLRAERRAGEMLQQIETAKCAPGDQYTGSVNRDDRSKTLAELGITKDQSSQWQRLADRA
jgi:hypothetical protein